MLQETVPVTWIRVEKPTLDIAGLILGALGLTVALALLAFALGAAYGTLLIRRERASGRVIALELGNPR